MTKLNIWWHNKKVNPNTKRRIKKGGKIYNSLLNECLLNKNIIDNYSEYRNNMIDPLTLVKLPTISNKPVFEYKYCWEPLSGEIIDKDPRGSLYFDPDSLIYYFYTNRLRYLWNDGDFNFSGNYGDALGNGPYFNIPGRGLSPHFYLFRLPLNDAFCDNISRQQITVAPILSYTEIENLYNISKLYGNNFKNLFGFDRPNLIELYNLYHEAINKNVVDEELREILSISSSDINENLYLHNKIAVDKLRYL